MTVAKIHGVEFPIRKIFSNDFNFKMPFYQRQCSWTTEQTGELLEDLISYIGSGPTQNVDDLSPYFLGSIVLIKGESQPDAVVVDGQQRLTTLQLLMEALRDLCRLKPEVEQKQMERLIENRDVRDPDDRFKVWPTNVDQDRITMFSFAVYSISNIAKALVKAAKRGVKLTVIVETPDKLGGENEYSTLRALGSEVEACSSVYFWPKEKRKLSETNKPDILHVKCAVADGEWLCLSSANLTQQALTIKMELGMLVPGGTMPRRVEQQFERLIVHSVLTKV